MYRTAKDKIDRLKKNIVGWLMPDYPLFSPLRAPLLLGFAHLGSKLRAEVLGFEQLADFDFDTAVAIGSGPALDPADGFLAGIDLDHGEAGDEFLGCQ